MSAKPTQTPEFNTDGSNRVEPSSGKKLTGYVAGGDHPTSGNLNWWMYLVYTFCLYIYEGALRGLHSIRATDETTYSPVLSGLDPSTGQRRWGLDHNGYPTGQISEIRENWFIDAGASTPVGWTQDLANSGAVLIEDPTADLPYRTAHLSTGASASSRAGVISPPIMYFGVDKTLKVEWDLRTGPSIDAGTAMSFFGGVQFSHGATWNRSVSFWMLPDTNANIILKLIDNLSVTDYITAVAIAVNTTYRLRIEIVGNTNHSGADTLARWFVNGVLVHSEIFTWSTADACRVNQRVQNTSTDDYDVWVGPIHIVWNHRGTTDAI